MRSAEARPRLDLDVVGATEAAAILDVEVPRLTRWLKSGRLPAPAVKLAATPVWHRTFIEALAAGEPVESDGGLIDAAGPLIVSTSEAAALLGKDKSQIGRWRRADRFPRPALTLAAGPIWTREAVLGFRP
jgi:hypothetical protein